MKLSKRISDLKSRLMAIEGAGDVLGDLDDLMSAAAQFDDLDATEAKTAIAELPRLQSSLTELRAKAESADTLQGQLTESQKTAGDLNRQLLAARTVNQAGILPEFHELLEPAIAAAVVPNDKGEYGLPDNFLDGLKGKYPSAFAAADGVGTGGAATGGAAPETMQTTTYKVGPGGTISGVNPDDVLNGSVVIS